MLTEIIRQLVTLSAVCVVVGILSVLFGAIVGRTMAVPADVMIATKVTMLEAIVRDLLVDRFNETDDPVGAARQYAATREQLHSGATIEPDLQPIREAVWQQFLDSVVAGVRRGERPPD